MRTPVIDTQVVPSKNDAPEALMRTALIPDGQERRVPARRIAGRFAATIVCAIFAGCIGYFVGVLLRTYVG